MRSQLLGMHCFECDLGAFCSGLELGVLGRGLALVLRFGVCIEVFVCIELAVVLLIGQLSFGKVRVLNITGMRFRGRFIGMYRLLVFRCMPLRFAVIGAVVAPEMALCLVEC